LPLSGARRRTAFIAITMSVALSVLGGCATPPRLAEPSASGLAESNAITIAVIDRGRHTDIALPAEALPGPLASLRQAFPGVRHLVFGFGDRAYFMAHETPFPASLAALFPGLGVILVTALRVSPAEAFGAENVVALRLTPPQLQAMSRFIQHSLVEQPDGSLQRLETGPYPGSVFYASEQTYDAFHNCNRWTAAALRSGGLAVDPDGVIFAAQVLRQARRIAAQPTGMPG